MLNSLEGAAALDETTGVAGMTALVEAIEFVGAIDLVGARELGVGVVVLP